MKLHHVNTLAIFSVTLAIAFGPVLATVQADLYLSSMSSSITKITPSGSESTFASGLGETRGLAFNSAGDLFVADDDLNGIYEITPSGSKSIFATGLDHPTGLTINSAGDLFESDADSNAIYEFTPTGTTTLFASGLDHPENLAFNSAGDLFEIDGLDNVIYEFSPTGTKTLFASGSLIAASGSFFESAGLAVNSAGDVFVGTGSSIIEITLGGSQSTFSSVGGSALAFDSAGDLFASTSSGLVEFPSGGGAEIALTSAGVGAYSMVSSPTFSVSSIPEPSMLGLWGLGALVCGGYAWRKKYRTA